jgi:uncharacterized C2H2 Zn-finger protein
MASKLTPRGRALRWLTNHRGITEDPPGSNCDSRKDGIRAAQLKLANGADFLLRQPWCGVWFAMALIAGGVKGVTSRLASVMSIEDDARAHKAPFRGWVTTAQKDWFKHVLRGDGVVLFGRGKHVETVRSVAWVYRKFGLIRTDGGNTTSGNSGDQANGGGAFPRFRKISDVHGFALVDYPDA